MNQQPKYRIYATLLDAFGAYLNHIVAVSYRLNFKSQNQSLTKAVFDTRYRGCAQSEYLPGPGVRDIDF